MNGKKWSVKTRGRGKMTVKTNYRLMKTRLSFYVILSAVILSALSCKEKGSSMLPAVSGSANEVLVLMNKTLWDGRIGDTVKAFFRQSQAGLPQPEPVFDLINLPEASFEKNVKSHRNVLSVQISPNVDTAALLYKDSPWARSQVMFKIVAPSDSAFFRVFDANKEKIMGAYIKAERERLVNVYKKTSDSKIFNLFKNKYGLLVYCPAGFVVNKDSSDFVWISSETKVDSKGLIFFQENYENQGQLNEMVIIDRVNQELKKHIPGPLPKTWMGLDTKTPYTFANYNYQGMYYAILFRGLWDVVNDFMGGPYVLNVVLDEAHNRIIYMLGYVYAPEDKKRNKLRQVEAVLYSMDFYNKENEGVKKDSVR